MSPEDPELDEFDREHIVTSRPASQILVCTVMEYAGYGILCHCTSNGFISAIIITMLFSAVSSTIVQSYCGYGIGLDHHQNTVNYGMKKNGIE